MNNANIHYGKFALADKNLINLFYLITKPSKYFEKITIVEGTTKKQIDNLLSGYFESYQEINYTDLLADTYFIDYNSSFEDFKYQLNENLNLYKEKFKSNILSKKFTFKEIMIIGSLLEKEGLDNEDKKLIFSVIINRLNKNMKLQIDATVIYAITKGKKKLERKLNYSDLKYKNPYNTYHVYGLPPEPISYVSGKTIDLILENYESNYLFYFYNTLIKKHIYSKNYTTHLKKLNEYRSKK
jgi:Predicted periplasmic solute-binding protein